jgi:twin BRCT domain
MYQRNRAPPGMNHYLVPAPKKVCLKDTRICCTGYGPDDTEKIELEVRSEGGKFRAGLTREVTHLIVGRVGTDKHRKAMSMPSVYIVTVRL